MATIDSLVIPSDLLASIPSTPVATLDRATAHPTPATPAMPAAKPIPASTPILSQLSSALPIDRRGGLSLKLAIVASLVMATGIGTWIFRLPMPMGTNQAIQDHTAAIVSTRPSDALNNPSGPQEIRFKPGEISSIVQGNLQDKNLQVYRLRAFKGQIMSVILDGSGVVMNLVQANRDTIDSAAAETRSWTGQLPADGEYELQITGSGRYTLDVSITPLSAASEKTTP